MPSSTDPSKTQEIRYEPVALGRFNRTVDAVVGQTAFEFKKQVRDLRVFHSAVIGLAQLLQDNPDLKATLIIDETRISPQRLEAEWQSYEELFDRSILARLSAVVYLNAARSQTLGSLGAETWDFADEIHATLSSKRQTSNGQSADSYLDLFRIMLINWFRRTGPLQIKALCHLSGYSYPTVASALEKMTPHLLRHSDRSVELKAFPPEIWRKLLVDSKTLRGSLAFAARKPRPLKILIENLDNDSGLDIGLGGIIGARHYLPDIDLVGTHRLDLTLNDASDEYVRDLTRRLDPALQPVDAGQAPQVVIHRVVRPGTFFVDAGNGRLVADEVECLLDLHEARLELQANELLEHLTERARS